MSGSTAKNFHKNGSELVIGGVLNVVGDGEIQKDGVPVDIGGGGSDVTWDTLPGKPSTFPPSSHTHSITDVSGLQSALDEKLESVSWGDVQGKPSTFPPASHTHTIEDIQNLQTTLDDILARLAALEGNGG